jgi:hypothetical protein
MSDSGMIQRLQADNARLMRALQFAAEQSTHLSTLQKPELNIQWYLAVADDPTRTIPEFVGDRLVVMNKNEFQRHRRKISTAGYGRPKLTDMEEDVLKEMENWHNQLNCKFFSRQSFCAAANLPEWAGSPHDVSLILRKLCKKGYTSKFGTKIGLTKVVKKEASGQ